VGDQDLTGLALTLQPGTTVNGRITFDHAPTDPPPQARLTLNAVQDAGQVIFGSVSTLTTSVEGLATAVVPPGRYSVTATGPTASPNRGPSGWTVKAVVVNGRDVTDVGVELRSSESVDMVVTLTDRHRDERRPATRPAGDVRLLGDCVPCGQVALDVAVASNRLSSAYDGGKIPVPRPAARRVFPHRRLRPRAE
jgi:hypothetical protein